MNVTGGVSPPPRSTWRRLGFIGVGAVVAVLASTAVYAVIYASASSTGTSPNPSLPATINLLPSDGTRSSCITGVPGVPRPTLSLENGTLQANTYSVPSGTSGDVGMCYDASNGTLFSYANWTRVGGSGGWFSYPQIAYGVNDYAGAETTYTNQSVSWALPQTVASTVNESLWVTSEYGLRAPNASDVEGYDLSLDDFISQGLPPRLEMGPFVEVEIFLAHNISYPFEWTHWNTETLVNAAVAVQPWDVAYWCHGTDNGSNANLSFDFSYGGQTTHGLAHGTVGVNLSAILAEVETLIPAATCWTGPSEGFSQFYLGEEDLGSEDGALGGTSFNYNWTVDAYCLHTHVSAPNSATLECHAVTRGAVVATGSVTGSAAERSAPELMGRPRVPGLRPMP